MFVDASDKAYAAVGYFRFSQGDVVKLALVMAKSKVAPVKPMSIPRLELEAAKIGARLATSIGDLHSFAITNRYFLSDSKCVLSWINSRSFKLVPFVAHRVSEILDLTSPEEWAYVPTKENVADDATKESARVDEQAGSRWFRGPDFLRRPLGEWPTQVSSVAEVEETNSIYYHQPLAATEMLNHPINRISARFRGKWLRLVHVVARVRQAFRRPESRLVKRPKSVSTAMLNEAENEIFRLIQRESFPEQWGKLVLEAESAASDDRVMGTFRATGKSNSMSLFMDPKEKLLRLSSRDRTSNSSYSAKHRILLPRSHEFVQLYLRHIHEENYHMGVESTIAEAREKVWIISIRQALVATIATCQYCKNRRA